MIILLKHKLAIESWFESLGKKIKIYVFTKSYYRIQLRIESNLIIEINLPYFSFSGFEKLYY